MEKIGDAGSHIFVQESEVVDVKTSGDKNTFASDLQKKLPNFVVAENNLDVVAGIQKEVCLNDTSLDSNMIESSDNFLEDDIQLRKHDTYPSILATQGIEMRTSKYINSDDINLSLETEDENMSNRITPDKLPGNIEAQNLLLEEGSNIAASVTEMKIPCDNEALPDVSLHNNINNVSVKHKNKDQEFTAIKRPKRKRSCTINYNENSLWDVKPLFGSTVSKKINGQSKQSRKVKQQKVPSETSKLIKSDSHFMNIFDNIHRLQKDGKYCDVKFCGSDGNILAHSLILIAASPLLHKQLKQRVKKNSNVSDLTELDFKDVPKLALQKIVTFLYTGSLEVAESEVKSLSKHCNALGLNELCKKLHSVDSVVLPEPLQYDAKKKMKDNTDASISDSGNIEIKNEEHSFNKKSRKRKLKCPKNVKVKIKLPKQCLDLSESDTGKKNNIIMNVEKPGKDCEVDMVQIVTKSNSLEETAKPEEIYCSDIDIDVNDDSEWNADHVDSGDDTDSYFVEKTNKNRNKKCKMTKKGIKNKENRRLKKSEKQEKMSNVNNEEKTLKFSTEVLAESENKVDENYSEVIESGDVGNKVQSEDRNSMSEESKEKLEVEIGSGNGGECEKCGKSFFFQYELTGHRNKCTGKNNRQRRKCVTCHVNFESTEDYMEHRNSDVRCIKLRQEKLAKRKQKRFEMRRKYCCCACSRKFRRLADQIEHEFLAHEIQYDKEKWPDLYCEYCNYWSMNPWKLHHHKLVSCNKGQEPICDMCGNTYKNEKTLKKHKELMHTDVQPMLTCEECGKTLKGQKGLKHHIRLRHRGENLHNLMMCHICSQTYRTSSDLTFHLYKVHDQPLPEGFTVYRCPRCDYCHNNKRFFDKHMFLHEDKREWHCDRCSKAFKTKNSLSTHMIVHTSDRIPCPFDDCTYKALKNCHLKNHVENQHTQKGEKHEKCHLCEYSTFFRGNLIKHQRSVHKLEVVTRHSVEMKARYKNLKSGHILGVKDDAISDKKSKNIDHSTSSVAQESGYPTSSSSSTSSDKSMVEDQCHFQDKTVPLPASQNVSESFVYTLNTPMITHHSNYPTNANMYHLPPIDFSVYNQNSSIDHM